jgi:hypothetical protein
LADLYFSTLSAMKNWAVAQSTQPETSG